MHSRNRQERPETVRFQRRFVLACQLPDWLKLENSGSILNVKKINSYIDGFMKVVASSVSFLEHLELSHLDICIASYGPVTEVYQNLIEIKKC